VICVDPSELEAVARTDEEEADAADSNAAALDEDAAAAAQPALYEEATESRTVV